MGITHDQLEAMTDEQVIERYNNAADYATGGLSFWREEVWRRANARQTQRAIELTEDARDQTATIRRLTWVITALTVLVAILTAASLWAVLNA